MSDNKLKILYAEDDKDVAESVARAISLCQDIHTVDIASNGEELVEMFYESNGKYDMLISDVQMPKLNGIDAISNIKSMTPDIFTIITTAYNDNEYLFKSIQLGIDKYLLKPLDLRELLDMVNAFNKDKKLKEEHALQKDMLMVRSKAATMGYMLDAVAHQWKQPLSLIAMLNSTIRYQLDTDNVDQDKLKSFTSDIDVAVDHMNDTLSEFRSFMRTDRIKSDFCIKECLAKVKNIIKYDLIHKKINIYLSLEKNFLIYGYANQFIHIILNFISNSIDAFEENNINDREIRISLNKEEGLNQVIYEDNAGGIPEDIISNIFDLDFTTKSLDKGSGVGLSLSKQIAANHNGEIKVENISNGVRFIVNIKSE